MQIKWRLRHGLQYLEIVQFREIFRSNSISCLLYSSNLHNNGKKIPFEPHLALHDCHLKRLTIIVCCLELLLFMSSFIKWKIQNSVNSPIIQFFSSWITVRSVRWVSTCRLFVLFKIDFGFIYFYQKINWNKNADSPYKKMSRQKTEIPFIKRFLFVHNLEFFASFTYYYWDIMCAGCRLHWHDLFSL